MDTTNAYSNEFMNAVIFTKYGSPEVLKPAQVSKPHPNENEILIKISAASVNAADWHLLRGEPFVARFVFGLFKPKFNILGADIAGTIEAIGRNITKFKVGDEVFGDLSSYKFGGFAEYVCARESDVVLKPANISFEEAAASGMAAVTALQGLRNKGDIKAGQKVLINGASGGVGTFAVQIAKSFGAEVTAVCSTNKIEMVKNLGADFVIDYTKEDFTKNGKQYDLIIGVNGYNSISDYKNSLSSNGIYVMSGGTNKQLFQAMALGPVLSINSSKKMTNVLAKPNQKDLEFVKDLLQEKKLIPVIDKKYELKDVAQAIQYLEEGHAKGKVIINIK